MNPITVRPVSLAVVFKGPEGIVLAADSRVTLQAQAPGGQIAPAYFDNATKLLDIPSQPYIGVVTYGQGAIGPAEPRTAHSYQPELDEYIKQNGGDDRLEVERASTLIGEFFLARWGDAGMPADAEPLVFLIGGYDLDAPYGTVYEVVIPHRVSPVLKHDPGAFGVTWGGQSEIASRLFNGFDPRALGVIKDVVGVDDQAISDLGRRMRDSLSLPIPYQFLPLQDCIDLSRYIVKMTATVQTWTLGIRGVGGAIDVATITRTDGFEALDRKQLNVSDL